MNHTSLSSKLTEEPGFGGCQEIKVPTVKFDIPVKGYANAT